MTENELRNSVAAVMESWLGATKGDSTHKAIIDIYNAIRPLPRGVRMSYTMDWCAAAVSAAFQSAGLIDLIPAECSCGLMLKAAQERGIWVEADDYKPKVGDLVMYDWQDKGQGDNHGAPDHVGLVWTVGDDYTWVMEGNTSGPSGTSSVYYRRLKIGGRYIRGYITPGYASKAAQEQTEAVTVSTAAWYQKAMEWAKMGGLMDGTRPEDPMTRAEVATALYRLCKTLKEV